MLKPLDIVVLSALLGFEPHTRRSFVAIARQLDSNPPAITRAVSRLTEAGLLHATRRGSLAPSDYRIDRMATFHVFVYALRYFMPVEPGAPHRGIATAHSGPDLREKIRSHEVYVWPYVDGDSQGLTIEPLDSSVPMVSRTHMGFYRILSLVDVFRVGRARERHVAEHCLKALLNETVDG